MPEAPNRGTAVPANDWIGRFEGLADLPAALRAELARGGRLMTVPAGTRVFAPGQRADALLLLLSGTVRVQQLSEAGREVLLYRVHAGESCILTTACMLAEEDYAAEGIAETGVAAVAVPRALFDDLAGRSPAFRAFVFRAYARRIADLFALIDDIVSRRMDVRLAERLLALARDGRVQATHQVLAAELGTAREVVSRILGEFQRRGWVEQARGELRLTAPAALERLAQGAADR